MKRVNYLFCLSSLALISSVACFKSGTQTLKTNAAESFNGVTFDYSKTENTSYIDGGTILKQLVNNPSQAEIDFVNKNYRVRYDNYAGKELGSEHKFYNFGKVVEDGKTNYYVEGFGDNNVTAKRVEYGGNSYNFNKVNYQNIAIVNNASSLDGAEIVYNYEISLDKDAANEILNAAYKVGKNEVNKQNALDIYNEKKDAYTNYQTNLQKYNEYKAAHDQWEVNNEQYQSYLAKKAQYDLDIAAYNNYINVELPKYESDLAAYKQYLSDLDAYNANIEFIQQADEKYQTNITKVNYQLDTFELLYTRFPAVEEGGTIFSYIFRGAVDQVLANQEDLAALGVPSSAVEKAGEATVKLRKLLTDYNGLRSNKTEEGKKARYNFIISNYTSIKNNLVVLTQCLEKFYQYEAVRVAIESQGKTQRYIYLVAELIYASECFSDTDVKSYDEVYSGTNPYLLNHETKIDGKTVQTILGLETITESTISMKPLSSYPVSVSGSYGEAPTPVEKPTKPVVVTQPIEPTVVAAAGNEPLPADYGLANANKPVQPEAPGAAPEARDSQYNSLYELVKNNTLLERTEITSNKTLNIEQSIEILSTDEQKIAVMYIPTALGAEIHEVAFFNAGGSPVLQHEIPVTSLGGGHYDYFNKWLDPNDPSVEINLNDNISDSTTINADFTRNGTLTVYDVSWVDEGGQSVNENTEGYGLFRPAFYEDETTKREITPVKEGDERTRYEFIGYRVKLSGSASYTDYTDLDNVKLPKCDDLASTSGKIEIIVLFREISRYSVVFKSEGTVLYDLGLVDEGSVINYGGATPTKAEDANGKYEFIGWKANGVNVTLPINNLSEDTVLEAQFKTIKKYTISYAINDGTSIGSEVYYEGETPYLPEAGVDFDKGFSDNYYYTFTGWNKTATPVTSNTTYIANYEKHEIIPGALITRVNGNLNITVTNSDNSLDISKLVELLGKGYEAAPTNIRFKEAEVKLSQSALLQIRFANITSLKLEKSADLSSVNFVAKKGSAVATEAIEATIILKNVSEIDHLKGYVGNTEVQINKLSKSSISYATKFNTVTSFGVYYLVEFSEYSNCSYKVNGEEVNANTGIYIKKGTAIEITAIAKDGYEVNKVFALDSTSQVVGSNDGTTLSLTINNDVTIYSNSSKLSYTISLYIDGKLFASIEAAYGTLVSLPDGFKLPSNGSTYVFTGWEGIGDADPNALLVTSNLSLNAKFVEVTPDPEGGVTQSKISYTKLAGEIGLGVLAFGAALGLIIVCTKKGKKEE